MSPPAAIPNEFSNDRDCIERSLTSRINKEGITILDDPKRLQGFLADDCSGENKREIVLLTHLLEEQVHKDLIQGKDSIPFNLLSANITQRILANHPFDVQLVQWGIDTISFALGIIPNMRRHQPNLSNISSSDIQKIRNLISELKNNSEDDSRNDAANQLSSFQDPSVVNALLKCVKNDPRVRYSALVSLRKIGDPLAIPAFIERLKDPSARIRSVSVNALGEIGDSAAIKSLEVLVKSKDYHSTLKNGGDPKIIQAAKDAIQNIRLKELSREGKNKQINPPISNNDELISQAIRFNQANQFHEALDILNQVIENYPNNPLTLREKGFALSNLGLYEESLHWYDLSLGIDSNDTLTWTYKGYALSKMGRMRDAIKMYDGAIKLDSNNAIAWRSKGYALVKLHDDHSAIMCYQKALEINSDDPITWNLIGWVKRDWNEKLRAFDRALSIDPQYVPAMINKGWVLSKFGRFQEALTIYERILTIDKNNQKAWDGRDRCQRMVIRPKKESHQPTHHPSQTHPIATQKNPGVIDRIRGFFK